VRKVAVVLGRVVPKGYAREFPWQWFKTVELEHFFEPFEPFLVNVYDE
jgi:hypothetical protein